MTAVRRADGAGPDAFTLTERIERRDGRTGGAAVHEIGPAS